VGRGEFEAIGRELVDLAATMAGLAKDQAVLDLGCGCGRLVLPLRRYLSPRGTYVGLDIVPEFVRWNRRWVTSVDPRFRFCLAAVRNAAYHPEGAPAATYTFPFADETFDTVLATSLFTHLVAEDARRYLDECARVLLPGGRLFATFFVLDDGVRERMSAWLTDVQFPWSVPYGRIADFRQPEAAVAYERWAVEAAIESSGLVLEEGIRPGLWSGVPGPTYQDLVIARRPVRQGAAPGAAAPSGTTIAP